MAWSMVGNPKVERITKKLASRFSAMDPAPNDRPLRESRMSYLSRAIEEEKFRTCEWAEATCKQTGKLYRINGKHTSTMLSGMNGQFPANLHAIVERYQCDTLEDVASLYSTFDTKASCRTQGDINRLFAASNPDTAEIPLYVVSRCITGMAYALFGLSGGGNLTHQGITNEQKAHLIVEHPNFACWVHHIIGTGGKDVAFLFRGPVIAAMFQTFQKSQKASDEFWSLVKDGTGAKPSVPDRKLQKYLMTTALGRGQGARTGKARDDERAMYARCVHAWNAWRRSETSDLKYFASAKLPIAS